MAGKWTEEQIAAAVDGSLEGPEAKEVRAAIESDPEARRYAEDIRRMNEVMREAFHVPEDEPVPAPIQAAVFGDQSRVSVLRRAVERRATWITAIAAALALMVAGVLYTSTSDRPELIALGETPADGPLHAALETLASGDASEAGIRPMLTFRDRDGRPCREFELAAPAVARLTHGIACRTGAGGWNVEAVLAAPDPSAVDAGYAPASGEPDALSAAIEALGAGIPLAPDEEASLIAGGWKGAE